ncbi:MAG: D-alanyl-lipoteichoic acid biosynthesis protein DltD [Terrimicrobiaceae bacterium]|nr:D-alanyl-lipoteichoic acid biosynthesis protein DltD [Terrimicrobiaceae bacterium]
MAETIRFWLRAPHVSAAVIAGAVAAILLSVLFGSLHLERRLAHLTAPQMLAVKDQGIALQDAAFASKDLLPIYGSSEFLNDSIYAGRIFFSKYPTGFELFTVGKAGAKTFIIAQRLAAVGGKLRGKKVVIILSPTWFLARREGVSYYDGNFSALQASELIFDSPLSLSLKKQFAQEMLKYPETLAGHDLLRMGLERLVNSNGAAGDRLVTDLGKTDDFMLQTLDRWQTAFSLTSECLEHPALLIDRRRHRKTSPDWRQLVDDADKVSETAYDAEQKSSSDPSARKLYQKIKGKRDASFTSMLDSSDEWSHLKILLQTLRELGARPLIINIPINARSFDTVGVTAAQRGYYYARLRDEVRSFHFPVVTYQEHENDPDFFGDSLGHPSAKGWMIFNRTIDQFYHDKLPAALD